MQANLLDDHYWCEVKYREKRWCFHNIYEKIPYVREARIQNPKEIGYHPVYNLSIVVVTCNKKQRNNAFPGIFTRVN